MFIFADDPVGLFEGLFGDVEAEVAGETVVARSWVFVVFGDGFARGDGEFAGEAVPHF